MQIRSTLILTLLLVAGPLAAAERVPDFNLTSPQGDRIHLGSLLEKGPVLLDFWATWCKPCVKAMPKLQSLHETFGARGLTVVGVNEDGPRGQAKVRPFLRSHRLTFPTAMDLDGSVMRRMQVTALPTTILLDSRGEVALRLTGYSPAHEEALTAALEALLPAAESEEK